MSKSSMSYKSRKDILGWGDEKHQNMKYRKLRDNLKNSIRVIAKLQFQATKYLNIRHMCSVTYLGVGVKRGWKEVNKEIDES